MSSRTCLLIGALSAALAVTLGAFGAHALRDQLEETQQLANWHTAVRYQMWHALALILVGVVREKHDAIRFAPWGFLMGSVLFSGSVYCLSLGVMKSVMGPVTPLGGLLLLSGWASFIWGVARSKPAN